MHPAPSIPPRLPATANDLATRVMREMNQHLSLGCQLTFDGRLEPDVLRRAVRLSLDVEPVLGCRLETTFRKGWWARLPDLDEHVPFSLLETEDADGEAIRARVAAIPDAGPQVSVRLLRSKERDQVCFAISHEVADGQGAKQYAYLLAELYSAVLLDAGHLPSPNLVPRPSARDMWERLTADERRSAGREPKATMPNWRLPRKGVTGRGRTLRESCLGPERLAALKAYGKERGATVNEMMLTAFFRSVARCFPPPAGAPMSLPFTADHRRYLRLREELPISNLATSIWMGVAWTAGESFEATLGRVVEQVTAWRRAMWGAKGAVRATGLAAIGFGPMRAVMDAVGRASAASGKTSPVFTNFGLLEERRVDFGGLVPREARLSGPAAFGASLVPTISTYRDTLWVSMGFCEEDMDAAVVDAVLMGISEEIASATGAGGSPPGRAVPPASLG